MAINKGTPEYNIILGLTFFILLIKLLVITYLTLKMREQKKTGSMVSRDFILSVTILMLCYFISRIFFMIFDFYYTEFDPSRYLLGNYIWYWKIGLFIAGIGQSYLIFVADRKLLNFKLKGIPAIIELVGVTFQLLYPLGPSSDFSEFSMVSVVGTFANIGIIIIPLIFYKIARDSTGLLKKTSYFIIFGIIFYFIGAMSVNGAIVDALNTNYPDSSINFDVLLYFIHTIGKSIGISLIGYGASKFQVAKT